MTALHEKATKIAIRGTQWRNYKKSHKATKAAAEEKIGATKAAAVESPTAWPMKAWSSTDVEPVGDE